jgi:hypothetical protein
MKWKMKIKKFEINDSPTLFPPSLSQQLKAQGIESLIEAKFKRDS